MAREGISERGLALASVLVAGTLVTATVAIALTMAGQRASHTGLQQRREASFHRAEAGIAVAFQKLAQRVPPFENPGAWTDRDPSADRRFQGKPSQVDHITITAPDGRPVSVTIRATLVSARSEPNRFAVRAVDTDF